MSVYVRDLTHDLADRRLLFLDGAYARSSFVSVSNAYYP